VIRRAGAPTNEADLETLLERGAEHHQAGRLSDAKGFYLEALEVDPENVEVLHRYGALLAAQAETDEERAEALEILRDAAERSVPIDETNASLHNNFGNALRVAGRLEDSERVLRAIVDAAPDSWQAWHNLGQTYKEQGRNDEAAAALRRSITLNPEYASNHSALGEVLCNLGRLNAAINAFQRALGLGPRRHDILTRIALVHRQLGNLAEAEALLAEVARITPDSPWAHANLAIIRALSGQFEAAAVAHERAFAIDPDNVVIRANRAYARLTAGDLPGAWDDWEVAINDGPRGSRRTLTPTWLGEDISRQRLMVHREQGVGDELLFASCYGDLPDRCGELIVETDPRITPLFARSFPRATVRAQTIDKRGRELRDEPDYDVVIPAGSLPRIVRPTVDTFPARNGFLVADPVRVEQWRERLATIPHPRVGISWRSKLNTAERRLEYTRLAEWNAIFGVPGVSFFNLQYDECERELADADRRFDVMIHRWLSVDYMNDFEEVAALMANLDLVVAPRNAVAMLAGALGIPTVMMGNRWDWSDLGTDTCPWFPSVSLVFRELDQEWDAVLARAAERVGALRSAPNSI
jgi:tetratricopeptide (TPR) repeat protein